MLTVSLPVMDFLMHSTPIPGMPSQHSQGRAYPGIHLLDEFYFLLSAQRSFPSPQLVRWCVLLLLGSNSK
jgi:hypothetical protein